MKWLEKMFLFFFSPGPSLREIEMAAKLDFINSQAQEAKKAKPIFDRAFKQWEEVVLKGEFLRETPFFVTREEYRQLLRCGHDLHKKLEGMPVHIETNRRTK